MLIAMHARAQYVYTINADSVKITNHCDSAAELIILNHTQGVTGGFLYNTWGGRTIFKKALQKINDSMYLIGPDTLKLPSQDTITNNTGLANRGFVRNVADSIAGTMWSLTGNAGIMGSGINFLGTTDNNPLILRAGNIPSGIIDPANTNTAFGYGALPSTFNGTSIQCNSAFGRGALGENTTGGFNVAVGFVAGIQTSTGTGNTAVGTYALQSNRTGSANVAIGDNAIGGVLTGSGNIGIGTSAGSNLVNGSNNIVIGNYLSAPKDTSSQLIIGSGATWIYGFNGLIGINNTSPAYQLDVNGQMNANLLSLTTNVASNPGDSVLFWNPTTHNIEMGSVNSSGGTSGSSSANGIGSGSPSYAAGSGAGTGATVSVDGTNEGGLITLKTGTSLVASGVLVTLTYSTPFPNNSYPITRAANAATAPVETTDQATYLSGSASGFSIVASSNVLSANTTYQWYYSVSGR